MGKINKVTGAPYLSVHPPLLEVLAERWRQVIVVGAGPAGLLLALQLARNGIHVEVLELASKLDDQPRATHYGPPAVYELRRAGVYDEVLRQGFLMRSVAWRKIDGTLLAALSGDDLPDDFPYKTTCLPLNRLATIIYDAIVKQGNVIVSWSHKVVGLGQDEKKAWVEVETPSGKKTLEADFIVGCDGANSQIRRSLFGDKSFPGHTWDKQIVATNACGFCHSLAHPANQPD